MTERHHGEMTLRTVSVSASRRLSKSGDTTWGVEWRESRNGLPEREDYASGHAADRARADEVAEMVADARAEALRRARQELGPGPLQRRVTSGWRSTWERIEDEARRCYRDYELNERLRLDATIGHWNPCQAPSGCETLTNREGGIWPMGPSWLLCDEHRTKEVCAELYGEMAGDSVHS